MDTPIDALVAEMVTTLDDKQREAFEERAAIIEFDACLSRAHAECLALLDVLRRNPAALTGITAFQVEQSGATQWFLTTDANHARMQLTQLGAIDVAPVDLADVVARQYGGIAYLTTV